MRRLDRRYARAKRPWTQEELDLLLDKYGLVSDLDLAKLLQRSPNALHVAAVRRLHISRTMNFYTATTVADELGIGCPKTIIWWVEKGWIRGRRSHVAAGYNTRWEFHLPDIEACIRERPWLPHLKRMPRGYLRSVVMEEYERDPWLSCQQAAAMVGLKTDDAIQRYIKRGWIPAVKAPGGPWQGRWIIRHSAVEAFLASDPRPKRSDLARVNILASMRRKGEPRKLSTRWLISCPSCRQDVVVTALPRLHGPSIMQRFAAEYCNGRCSHGAYVDLMK